MSTFLKLKEAVGVTVSLSDDGGVSIESPLQEECPMCGRIDCYDCEFEEDHLQDNEDRRHFNQAMDGLEALLMSMAGKGVDLNDPRIVLGVQDAIQGIAANTC